MSLPLPSQEGPGIDVAGLHMAATAASQAIGTWRDVLIAAFGAAIEPSDVERLEATLERHAQRRRPVALVLVIEEEAAAASATIRRALARVLARHAGQIRCSAFVVSATEFHAAAARAIITSVALMSQLTLPQVVVSNVPTAANWVERHLDTDAEVASTGGLGSAIAEVRAMALATRR